MGGRRWQMVEYGVNSNLAPRSTTRAHSGIHCPHRFAGNIHSAGLFRLATLPFRPSSCQGQAERDREHFISPAPPHPPARCSVRCEILATERAGEREFCCCLPCLGGVVLPSRKLKTQEISTIDLPKNLERKRREGESPPRFRLRCDRCGSLSRSSEGRARRHS